LRRGKSGSKNMAAPLLEPDQAGVEGVGEGGLPPSAAGQGVPAATQKFFEKFRSTIEKFFEIF